MAKTNWLFLCFEMMCDYFPSSYERREDKRMFLELAEHFYALENRIEHRLSAESKIFFNRTIGLGYTRNEMHETALPLYKKAFDFLTEINHRDIGFEEILKTYYCMAECYSQLDDYENALKYVNLLIGYLTAETNCRNNYYFAALLYRAKIYRFYGEGHYESSKSDYKKALELETFIIENYCEEHFVDVVAAHVGLATTYAKMGQDGEAVKHLHYSCEMIDKGKQGMVSEKYAYVFYDIGLLYGHYEETDKALRYFIRSLEIEEMMFADEAHPIHLTLKKLAGIYKQKGNVEMTEYFTNRASLYNGKTGQNKHKTL